MQTNIPANARCNLGKMPSKFATACDDPNCEYPRNRKRNVLDNCVFMKTNINKNPPDAPEEQNITSDPMCIAISLGDMSSVRDLITRKHPLRWEMARWAVKCQNKQALTMLIHAHCPLDHRILIDTMDNERVELGYFLISHGCPVSEIQLCCIQLCLDRKAAEDYDKSRGGLLARLVGVKRSRERIFAEPGSDDPKLAEFMKSIDSSDLWTFIENLPYRAYERK